MAELHNWTEGPLNREIISGTATLTKDLKRSYTAKKRPLLPFSYFLMVF